MKTYIINALGNLFSLDAVNSFLTQQALTVFLYHDVSSNPGEFSKAFNLNVVPTIFEYQINFIRKEFNIISPDDLLDGQIPPRAALITFDDGFRSYFTTAVPILDKYAIPSIIFLNMEPVKGGMFWSGLITYLCQENDDFVRFLRERHVSSQPLVPLFLRCSKKIVEEFFMESGKKLEDFRVDVDAFVGAFANENDLREAENNHNIFLGNHLYNHEVPILMSDEEFLIAYRKNRDELSKYRNFRDVFSFPFGQPGISFQQRQIDLLFNNGALKLFYSSGTINSDVLSSCLNRISLASDDDSSAGIWFRICRQIFRKKVKL